MNPDEIPDAKALRRLEAFLAGLRRQGVMRWKFSDGQELELGPLPAPPAPEAPAVDPHVVRIPAEPAAPPSTLEHVMLLRGLPKVG